jgi:Dinucleotide-utilizing enzymes involved in molybdopterin and thiamine biosynthesis family 1
MGAGARMDPSKIEFADISRTRECSLAKAVRKRLSKMGIKKGVPTVFSTETPIKSAIVASDDEKFKNQQWAQYLTCPQFSDVFLLHML